MYVIIIKKMSQLKVKIKIVIKNHYTWIKSHTQARNERTKHATNDAAAKSWMHDIKIILIK